MNTTCLLYFTIFSNYELDGYLLHSVCIYNAGACIYIHCNDKFLCIGLTGSSKTQNYLYQAKEKLHRYKRESFRLNPPLPFSSYRCKTPGKKRVDFFKEKFWVLVTLSLATPIGAKPILVHISTNVIHCPHVPCMMVSEEPIHSVWQLKPMNVLYI